MAPTLKITARSISLPTRSHPSTIKVEEQLNKLKIWEDSSRLSSGSSSSSSSSSICDSLSELEDLYVSIDNLLNLLSTQQVLSQSGSEVCIDELLDGSMKLLDICSITRDSMLQIKEQVQSLRSAFRRRRGDSSIETNIASYNSLRKKVKKDTKKMVSTLKTIDAKLGVSILIDSDHHLSSVIRVLREVNSITSSIFISLLVFLSAPASKMKQSRWSLVSKLMHKGVVDCEEKQQVIVNEFESVDYSLSRFDAEKMHGIYKNLGDLETTIEGIDNGLENMFRRLIRARASLLNIISQ